MEFEGFDIDMEQLTMEAPVVSPIAIGDTILDEGRFTIEGDMLKDFHDKALHLDKKSEQSYITLAVMNNYCFVYSLNIGIELYAIYGCECDNQDALILSLPLNRILKLLNTPEKITFQVTADNIMITKKGMEVNIKRVDTLYVQECTEYVNALYGLYEDIPTDTLTNTELSKLIAMLTVYANFNNADERLILLDKETAYVRGKGYYVYTPFATEGKYLVNNTLSSMLLKLSNSITLDEFGIQIICKDDIYTIIANNYVLNFPRLDGEFKFTLLGKIKPVRIFKANKKELVTALKQIDLYTETDCGITLNDKIYLQNHTSQGIAKLEVHSEHVEGELIDNPTNYAFNYDKLLRVLGGLKTPEVLIMECNTGEHLYLSDDKMSHFIILSVR